MEKTPKLRRTGKLSLGRLKKRESSSPQTRLRSNSKTSLETPHSPSVISVSSDNGIESTPPHKRFQCDDSMDSPARFDYGFSPGSLLSQTMTVDSPEVSWHWGRVPGRDKSAATPDSAYAADSFTSAGSSGSESAALCNQGTIYRKRNMYDLRREEQGQIEIEQRRAEKARADELLKERCARLQEQLDNAEKQRQQQQKLQKQDQAQEKFKHQNIAKKPYSPSAKLPNANDVIRIQTLNSHTKAISELKPPVEEKYNSATNTKTKVNNTIDDFFNDSESDGFLLEATQQMESQIIKLTQKSNADSSTCTGSVVASNENVSNPNNIIKDETSSNTEKRSSLYMKFLEDDSPDDWFLSLDDVIQQAMQVQKSRTTFQRYNSMPVATTAATTVGDVNKSSETNASSMLMPTSCQSGSLLDAHIEIASSNRSAFKMKRHASSHAISPSSTSYRARQLHMRK